MSEGPWSLLVQAPTGGDHHQIAIRLGDGLGICAALGGVAAANEVVRRLRHPDLFPQPAPGTLCLSAPRALDVDEDRKRHLPVVGLVLRR